MLGVPQLGSGGVSAGSVLVGRPPAIDAGALAALRKKAQSHTLEVMTPERARPATVDSPRRTASPARSARSASAGGSRASSPGTGASAMTSNCSELGSRAGASSAANETDGDEDLLLAQLPAPQPVPDAFDPRSRSNTTEDRLMLLQMQQAKKAKLYQRKMRRRAKRRSSVDSAISHQSTAESTATLSTIAESTRAGGLPRGSDVTPSSHSVGTTACSTAHHNASNSSSSSSSSSRSSLSSSRLSAIESYSDSAVSGVKGASASTMAVSVVSHHSSSESSDHAPQAEADLTKTDRYGQVSFSIKANGRDTAATDSALSTVFESVDAKAVESYSDSMISDPGDAGAASASASGIPVVPNLRIEPSSTATPKGGTPNPLGAQRSPRMASPPARTAATNSAHTTSTKSETSETASALASARLSRPTSFSNRQETIKKQREEAFFRNQVLFRKQSKRTIGVSSLRHRSFTVGANDAPGGFSSEAEAQAAARKIRESQKSLKSLKGVDDATVAASIKRNSAVHKRLRRWQRTSFARIPLGVSDQLAKHRSRKKLIDRQADRVAVELPHFVALANLSAAQPILVDLTKAYASQLGEKHPITLQARARLDAVADALR
ncbi:uncharacterized protein AMSG_06067 [Thecamonas trahens ATCC 50062]|uniref:Uncharacterized protein n=1 Tax=Thecamonas trahens ATCC 50062 TaxID=461836 RepID=A0A0L0DEN4_THETB|nr:hypothetical protein AMSG_06067 [Thecamonas trahens ATCC 50062]KNC49788.1 hypothetical protein AMSG_06067 [Thecamonas trahens ATCC 50062]|eukprot:XP_013757572.1 hypothetical protein AMSG_06067 [Thecamonas trahens ATCC 50062]